MEFASVYNLTFSGMSTSLHVYQLLLFIIAFNTHQNKSKYNVCIGNHINMNPFHELWAQEMF